MGKSILKILPLALCFTFFGSCKKSDIQRVDFEAQLQSKYQNFIQDKIEVCKLKAIQEAEIGVDSIIDRILSKDLIDSLDFPEKPIRPERRF